ncbi:MAG TPA: GTPase Era [Eubacteriaceae bacterium]|nr:GTPase Era [Eubacteriaceae bacterium]
MSFKSGFISIIGRSNVGKSTLLNRIIGEKMVIVSSKPQTTRNVIRCIRTTNLSQMVFLDTPGIHKPKNKLSKTMMDEAMQSIKDVDLIAFMMDDAKKPGPGDQYIIDLLKQTSIPKILIINKIDTMEKGDILQKIDTMQAYEHFDEIVPISATKGDNVERLIEIFEKYLPEGPHYFPEDMVTEQPERQIVAELIREKALECLREEIPHGIAVGIDSMKERRNGALMDIEATIFTEKKSHKGMIIGKQGQMLKKIGTKARRDIEGLLATQANLQLWVKVKEDWRDKEFDLRNFGYMENKKR